MGSAPRSLGHPDADTAVVVAVAEGATSGLTALDRARRGRADALRVMVVGEPDGTATFLADTLGYTVTVVSQAASGSRLEARVAESLAGNHVHALVLDGSVLGERLETVLAAGVTELLHPPIIVLDDSDQVEMRTWLERGADDHVSATGVDASSLRRAVEAAVARNRARELRRRLAHADRLAAIGTLAAGVAHEVNNPSAYVLMNLKTCREHVAALRRDLLHNVPSEGTPSPLAMVLDEMDEMLADNVRGVERIVRIVQALRSYARSDPDELSEVDLSAVCRDALELIGNQLRHKARVVSELVPVPAVVVDARKITKAVLNVLVNAADAIPVPSPGDPEIRIRCTSRNGRVEVSVSDSGVGIPASHQARIFQPFFTTKVRGDGIGMGLTVVRDTVDRFGGQLRVDSQVGSGTTVTMGFPIEGSSRQRTAEAVPVAVPTRARLLIIDDEVALTSALRRQLRAHHDVTVINDGAAGLAAVLRQEFDVVLCDVMMPGTDGLALLEALHRRRPEMVPRLVLMTAGVFADTMRDRVLAAGGQVIDKPVPIESLLALVEAIGARTQQ